MNIREKLDRGAALNGYTDGDMAPITRGELRELLDYARHLEEVIGAMQTREERDAIFAPFLKEG